MQQVSNSVCEQSPQQLIPARTIFSIRPIDPPSSPPPTSPLPPLPEIAPYQSARSTSSASPLPRYDRPRRPPRPSASLSELKPRTIQSPEIARRQRSAELAAQIRASPSPSKGRSSTPVVQKRSSIRLLSPTPESISTFSDDVLGALPRLFRSSPTSPLGTGSVGDISPTTEDDRIRAWQVYHGTISKGSMKRNRSRKETRKPVARSALFLPPKIFPQRHDSLQSPRLSPAPDLAGSEQILDNTDQMRRMLFSPFHSPKGQTRDNTSTDVASSTHFTGSSVDTIVPFDFGHTAFLPSYSSQISCDNLTSLPRLPSTPSLTCIELPDRTAYDRQANQRNEITCQTKEKRDSPSETMAFLSLPYSRTQEQTSLPMIAARETVCTAEMQDGVVSPTSHHSRPTATQNEPETVDEEEAQPLTEEQMRKAKRKRLFWALSTISLVLVATAGILGGIIWKLNNL